jgi:hypothetical protein
MRSAVSLTRGKCVNVAHICKELANLCLRSDRLLMLLFCSIAPQHPTTKRAA